jgi:hypothetical protein
MKSPRVNTAGRWSARKGYRGPLTDGVPLTVSKRGNWSRPVQTPRDYSFRPGNLPFEDCGKVELARPSVPVGTLYDYRDVHTYKLLSRQGLRMSFGEVSLFVQKLQNSGPSDAANDQARRLVFLLLAKAARAPGRPLNPYCHCAHDSYQGTGFSRAARRAEIARRADEARLPWRIGATLRVVAPHGRGTSSSRLRRHA